MKRIILLLSILLASFCIHSLYAQRIDLSSLSLDEYHLFVTPATNTVPLPSDSPYLFHSLREALVKAEQMQQQTDRYTTEHPLVIYIAPSVYWLDDPDDPTIRKPLPGESTPFALKLHVSHLRLIGLGHSAEETVIACNRGQTQGADGNFTMLHLTGCDITLERLTFGNYCNVDLDYPWNSALSRPKRADAIVQAQLILCDGDRLSAHQCRFISRLNSCPLAGARRALFKECYFECTDDALCGTGVYLGCRFTFYSSKPFYCTEGTGAVFLDCDLHTLTHGRQYLVKAGSPVSMVDCRWTSDDSTLFIGWTQNPTDALRCYQHNLTLNGQPLLIQADRPELTCQLAHKPMLMAYKLSTPQGDIYNVYNLLRGTDGWDPLQQRTQLEAIVPEQVLLSSTTCFNHLQLSQQDVEIVSGSDSVWIEAYPLRPATRKGEIGSGETIPVVSWHIHPDAQKSLQLHPLPDNRCLLTGNNLNDESMVTTLLATTADGVEAACRVVVHPNQLPPPIFTQTPQIQQEGDSVLALHYQLDLQGRADQSLVTWYRCKQADGRDTIPVAVSRLHTPLLRYRLTPADSGCYLLATISPKHLRSKGGEKVSIRTSVPIQVPYTDRSVQWCSDFRQFPTRYQPQVLPGYWSIDCYKPIDTQEYDWQADTLQDSWKYGQGVDGAAQSYGLIQLSRGARLRYTPLPGKVGDMEVTLLANPCKTAGQGFGSATGQYMDICLKFDTYALTGYALRIIRTPHNDKAVDFLLMRYEKGVATPISQAISSICYRTGCRIRLSVKGNRLLAEAENLSPLPLPHREGLTTRVTLEADIQPTDAGGFCIQHTGSTGANATVLSHLDIRWERIE